MPKRNKLKGKVGNKGSKSTGKGRVGNKGKRKKK